MADASSPLHQFQLWRSLLPPALRVLLTVNVATYVAYVLLSIVGQGGLVDWLALPASPEALVRQPWGVLTWGVANAYPGFFGLIIFFFGMSWLSLLGRDVEGEGRPETLLGLYVFATLGGAALALAAAAAGFAAMPVYFGVWGPLLGVLCYVGVRHPDRPVGLFLLGVVAMKWIAIGAVVLELAFSKDPSHLGAALAGALFAFAEARGVALGGWAGVFFRDRSRRAEAPRRGVPVPMERTERRAARPAPPRRSTAGDIDAILDKINETGMNSLTDEERRILSGGAGNPRRRG